MQKLQWRTIILNPTKKTSVLPQLRRKIKELYKEAVINIYLIHFLNVFKYNYKMNKSVVTCVQTLTVSECTTETCHKGGMICKADVLAWSITAWYRL